MMQQDNEVLRPTSFDTPGQPKLIRQRCLASLILVIVLTLFTLAYTLIGSRPQTAIGHIVHLPTFTRTPLPTLTPTTASTPVTIAMAAPPTVTIPPLPPPPTVLVGPVITPSSGEVPVTLDASGINTSPASAGAVTASPTNPPTSAVTEPPLPTPTPMATAPVAPSPTNTPTETPTATSVPRGWVFSGVWAAFDQDEGGLRLYGDVLNNTGASQELTAITGTFYDGQGQVILDGNTEDYWPIAAVAPAGRVPFELVAPGLPSAASFDLRVEAKPSNDTPRQDFELLDVTSATEGSDYCLTGKLRNPGGDLQSYLVIAAILFDSQDNLLNYADYYEYYPKDLGGGQTRDFEICVDALNQAVARYELRAWGL